MTKYQCIIVFTIGGAFLASVACRTTGNKSTAIALMFLGCFWIGWNETICLANTTICLKDHRDIGIGGGLGASMRAAICVILVAAYTTILSNRLTQTTATIVPPALVKAGIPAGSTADFIKTMAAVGTAAPVSSFAGIKGVTKSILAAGVQAYQIANVEAYKTVYLSTIAFSGLAIVLTFFAPNTEEYMTNSVAATLAHESSTSDEERGEKN